MVAPLITGAARVASTARKTRSKQQQFNKTQKASLRLAQRRSSRSTEKQSILPTTMGKNPAHQFTNSTRRGKRMLAKKLGVKKIKKLAKEIGVLANAATYAGIQSFFGILMLVALQAEDGFWGFIIPGEYMALLFWSVASFIGTTTMLVSVFVLSSKLKHIHIVIVGILCFSGNIVPGLQIIPWTMVWIGYIIFHEK